MTPEDRELEALQERLDRAFATTRPRRGFEDQLWARLEARRPFWARLRSIQLVPTLGGVVALAFVVLVGGLLLTGHHLGGGSASTTSAAAPGGGAKAQSAAQDASAPFGRLPRPSLSPPASATPERGPVPNAATRDYAGPVAVTRVTATLTLPASAQVARYPEWKTADADGFAARAGAQPATPAPAGALGRYVAAGYSMDIFPTDAAQGLESRVVITPKGPEPAGSPPEDSAAVRAAQAFLAGFQVGPDAAAAGPTVDRRGALVSVLWSRVLGVSASAMEVGADGAATGWQVSVRGDLSVFQASAPVPLQLEFATYGLATAQQLAQLVQSPAGAAAGAPQVVLDRAQLVYVVATDGTFGYLEPAVMYTGHFTQAGVQYQKRIIVPAVAPQNLR